MKFLVYLTLMLTIITSCNTQKVSVDYDRGVDFSQIKTYKINKNNNIGLSEFDQIRFYETLQNQLKYKGIIESENSDTEIKIIPKEYISSRTATNVGVGIGTGILRRVGGGVSVGIPVASKNLNQDYVISMYKEGKLIWEGILKLQMPVNASAEVKQANISKGISKLLQNYPPK